MRMRITFIILSGFMFLMSPLTQAAESVDDVLKEAKALFKKADTLQGAWVTTGKLIKKAEASLKKGNKANALKLAKMARLDASSSIAQAEDQAKNWADHPIYNANINNENRGQRLKHAHEIVIKNNDSGLTDIIQAVIF